MSSVLVEGRVWLRLVGGGFLCYLGARTFVARPATRTAEARGSGLSGAWASTFVLTLTNPTTILSFVAIFAGLGAVGGGWLAAAALVAGVFLGSALWWLLLSGGVGLLRARVQPAALAWVNRLSGALIAGFGVTALLSLLG